MASIPLTTTLKRFPILLYVPMHTPNSIQLLLPIHLQLSQLYQFSPQLTAQISAHTYKLHYTPLTHPNSHLTPKPTYIPFIIIITAPNYPPYHSPTSLPLKLHFTPHFPPHMKNTKKYQEIRNYSLSYTSTLPLLPATCFSELLGNLHEKEEQDNKSCASNLGCFGIWILAV